MAMYAGLVDSVEIPKGRVKILKNGYVYWITESHWDNARKMTVDNRVVIGKLDETNNNKMYPNKKYEQLFDTGDSNVEKLKKKYEPIATEQAGKIDTVMSYGAYAVMKAAAEKCGCLEALKKAFPSLWHKIFAVGLHSIVAGNSTAQAFAGWAFDNYCGLRSSISDSEISKLYGAIADDRAAVLTFFELYGRYYHEAFPQYGERVVAFDSTNQQTNEATHSKAKRGKSKEGGLVSVINTAMYVDEATGIAQYYEHFDGNVLDKTQSPYTIEKAIQLGFRKLFLMQDRGYFSKGNLESIENLGIGYGMMLPETTDIATKLINEHLPTIKLNEHYHIANEDAYGIPTTVVIAGKEYYAYVFYDDNTAKAERDAIHGNVNYWLDEAGKRKNFTEKMKEHYGKRAIKVTKTERDQKTGKNYILEIDHDMVADAIRNAGAFVVLSNRKMDISDMISIARKRDCVEKTFRTLKCHFDLKKTYTHGDRTYDGKMFVAFVALIVLQSYSYFIQNVLHSKTANTVATTLSELHKYKIQYGDKKNWFPLYACNKQQKDILACFELTQENIENQVRALRLRV